MRTSGAWLLKRAAFLVQTILEKVVGFYERAVQLDPAFALAWARLSRANAQVYFGQSRFDHPLAVTRRSGP